MHFVDKALTWQSGDRVCFSAFQLSLAELAQADHFALKCFSISN